MNSDIHFYALLSDLVYNNNSYDIDGEGMDGGFSSYIIKHTNELIIVFRGSHSWQTILINVSPLPWKTLSLDKKKQVLHGGYYRYYERLYMDRIKAMVRDHIVRHPDATVTVTGHSLGGACAVVCALDIAHSLTPTNIKLVTFGAPPVGDEAFCSVVNDHVPNSVRVVLQDDPVPDLYLFFQHHPSQELRLSLPQQSQTVIKKIIRTSHHQGKRVQVLPRLKDLYPLHSSKAYIAATLRYL